MMLKDTRADVAVKYFREGYNCAQSVLLAMLEHWNGENDLVPKIATGFGGGIGRCGSVCGALTGGVMAIGIRYGTNEPSVEKRLKSYEFARKLYREFERTNCSAFCRELIGYDLSDPEQLEEVRRKGILESKCTTYIRSVVEILTSLTDRQ